MSMEPESRITALSEAEIDQIFGGANTNPGYGNDTADSNLIGPAGHNQYGLSTAYDNTRREAPLTNPGNGQNTRQ